MTKHHESCLSFKNNVVYAARLRWEYGVWRGLPRSVCFLHGINNVSIRLVAVAIRTMQKENTLTAYWNRQATIARCEIEGLLRILHGSSSNCTVQVRFLRCHYSLDFQKKSTMIDLDCSQGARTILWCLHRLLRLSYRVTP